MISRAQPYFGAVKRSKQSAHRIFIDSMDAELDELTYSAALLVMWFHSIAYRITSEALAIPNFFNILLMDFHGYFGDTAFGRYHTSKERAPEIGV